MKITIEKSLRGKLSQFVINSVDNIYVTHLPGNSLLSVLEAADKVNQQVGKELAVPHCAARNITSFTEFNEFIAKCKKNRIKKVLLIGGSVRTGTVFQTTNEVVSYYKSLHLNGGILPEIEFECGLYPQNETFQSMKNKLHGFQYSAGITQLCMDTKLLKNTGNLFGDDVKIGIPSMCSGKGLWRYLKICGNRSFKYMIDNWRGVFYIKQDGFDVKRFTSRINHNRYHIYDFGRLEKTVNELLS